MIRGIECIPCGKASTGGQWVSPSTKPWPLQAPLPLPRFQLISPPSKASARLLAASPCHCAASQTGVLASFSYLVEVEVQSSTRTSLSANLGVSRAALEISGLHPCEYTRRTRSAAIRDEFAGSRDGPVNVGRRIGELRGVLPPALLSAARAVGAVLSNFVRDVDTIVQCPTEYGTCFHVAPNVLMTAAHVDLLSSRSFVFDYEFEEGDKILSPSSAPGVSSFGLEHDLDLPEDFDENRFPCSVPDPKLQALRRLDERLRGGDQLARRHLVYDLNKVIFVSPHEDFALCSVHRWGLSYDDRLLWVAIELTKREFQCQEGRSKLSLGAEAAIRRRFGGLLEPRRSRVGPWEDGIPLAQLRGWPIERRERATWVGHPWGAPKRAGRGHIAERTWDGPTNEADNAREEARPIGGSRFRMNVSGDKGCSGGPVFDDDGFVRGIVTAADRDPAPGEVVALSMHSVMRSSGVGGQYVREMIRRVAPQAAADDSGLCHWIAPVVNARPFATESILYRSRDGHLILLSSAYDDSWVAYDLSAFGGAGGQPPLPLPGVGTQFSVVTDSNGVEHLYYWTHQQRLVHCWRSVASGTHLWRWSHQIVSSQAEGFPRFFEGDRGEFVHAWLDGSDHQPAQRRHHVVIGIRLANGNLTLWHLYARRGWARGPVVTRIAPRHDIRHVTAWYSSHNNLGHIAFSGADTGAIYHTWGEGSAWAAPDRLITRQSPVRLASAYVPNAEFQQHLIVLAQDGHLYHFWWNTVDRVWGSQSPTRSAGLRGNGLPHAARSSGLSVGTEGPNGPLTISFVNRDGLVTQLRLFRGDMGGDSSRWYVRTPPTEGIASAVAMANGSPRLSVVGGGTKSIFWIPFRREGQPFYDLSARTGPPMGTRYARLDFNEPGRLGQYQVPLPPDEPPPPGEPGRTITLPPP